VENEVYISQLTFKLWHWLLTITVIRM